MSIYVFFTVNFTMICSFSLSKTVIFTVFYSYLPCIVRKLSVNQLKVLHCRIFTVFYC